MTDMILADPVTSDGPSADWRVLEGDASTGVGVHRGVLVDLALDDDGVPGSRGFDAFDVNGQYVGHRSAELEAAELLRNPLGGCVLCRNVGHAIGLECRP